MATLNDLGEEVLDQTPVAVPIPFTRPEPLHLRLRRMIEQFYAEAQQKDDYETFEDADDFDVADGAASYEDAPSEYEAHFMPSENVFNASMPLKGKPPQTEQATPAPAEGGTAEGGKDAKEIA